MKVSPPTVSYPNRSPIASQLSFKEIWDSEAVAAHVRSKSDFGETPAFLFLGRKEVYLLKKHLAKAFGDDAVMTINRTYYMGLQVVPIRKDYFFATGGRKTVRTLQDPLARRPEWQDRESEALWQLRL